jgi:hypothetical protein
MGSSEIKATLHAKQIFYSTISYIKTTEERGDKVKNKTNIFNY